jgi:hypothetical protein
LLHVIRRRQQAEADELDEFERFEAAHYSSSSTADDSGVDNGDDRPIVSRYALHRRPEQSPDQRTPQSKSAARGTIDIGSPIFSPEDASSAAAQQQQRISNFAASPSAASAAPHAASASSSSSASLSFDPAADAPVSPLVQTMFFQQRKQAQQQPPKSTKAHQQQAAASSSSGSVSVPARQQQQPESSTAASSSTQPDSSSASDRLRALEAELDQYATLNRQLRQAHADALRARAAAEEVVKGMCATRTL